MDSKKLVVVGYSGHAYVCMDIAIENDFNIIGYCDKEEKEHNPYGLEFLGREMEEQARDVIQANEYFIGIGHNVLRCYIMDEIAQTNRGKLPVTLFSKTSSISPKAIISEVGVLVASNVVVNALAKIGDGVILNSGCIVEHECEIGEYAHIAPGAVLAGNVKVGRLSFIGANSVVKQGVTIGKNVTVGAGAVVLENVPDNAVAVGNPAKIIKYKE